MTLAVAVLLAYPQSLEVLREKNLLLDVDLLVNTTGSEIHGSKDARLTILEFFDYGCPYCAIYTEQTLSQVFEGYVKTGKVRYIFRNLPNEKIHSLATKAAEFGECAGEQGKAWEAHLSLFKDQEALDTAALGLDSIQFRKCMESGRAAAKVAKELEEGRALKVPGTPSFYFGYPDSQDPSKLRALRLLVASQNFRVFKDVIEGMLNSPPDRTETQAADRQKIK